MIKRNQGLKTIMKIFHKWVYSKIEINYTFLEYHPELLEDKLTDDSRCLLMTWTNKFNYMDIKNEIRFDPKNVG